MLQIFGTISNPLDKFSSYGNLQSGGLINFLSNIVKIIIVAGGVWSFINLILAGFQFITAGGNTEQITAAWKKIYMSLIGLVLLVSSYIIAVLLSYLLYGQPNVLILHPKIFGPGTP